MATTSLSYNITEKTLIDTDKMPDWERLEKRRANGLSFPLSLGGERM